MQHACETEIYPCNVLTGKPDGTEVVVGASMILTSGRL